MNDARVLFVEDDRLYRRSLGEALEELGCTVIEAGTAAQATARLYDDIDLVLLDYRLPDGRGLDLLDRIHASLPGRPIIVLTAYPDPEVAREAIRLGVYEYLDKLDTHDHVLSVVQRALERSWMKC